jgi:AcrR family transcriptional regulator
MASPSRVYAGIAADERRALRRARLLEAGLQLLGTKGARATTVTAVCRHARLTPRYFYESFRDLGELLVAIFDATVAELTEEVRARAVEGGDMRATVRATIAAWVEITARDPRKGRVAFVEALGSEPLMRRRLETSRRFADLTAELARTFYGVSARETPGLEVASLVVAGGLIETMVEWLEGGLARAPEDVVEDFTNACVASLEAAIPQAASP